VQADSLDGKIGAVSPRLCGDRLRELNIHSHTLFPQRCVLHCHG
jgi:hypothetical protein